MVTTCAKRRFFLCSLRQTFGLDSCFVEMKELEMVNGGGGTNDGKRFGVRV